jgi:hypothetical protein
MKKPPVKSIRHKDQKRVHIPSGEEAGYEAASPLVQAKAKSGFPKNPIVHRGQDPELYWLNKYGEENDATPLAVNLRSLYRHEHIAPEALIKASIGSSPRRIDNSPTSASPSTSFSATSSRTKNWRKSPITTLTPTAGPTASSKAIHSW